MKTANHFAYQGARASREANQRTSDSRLRTAAQVFSRSNTSASQFAVEVVRVGAGNAYLGEVARL
jgi:hypothetical protein